MHREMVSLEGLQSPPPAPAIAILARIGLSKVPADKFADGYDSFSIRTDLRDFYLAAHSRVHALGEIVTLSGAIRDPGAPVTFGRSPTSLHYTGRAFDLFIYTGWSTTSLASATSSRRSGQPAWSPRAG